MLDVHKVQELYTNLWRHFIVARHEEDVHGTHTEVPEKVKSTIEQQRAKHAIEKFFQSFRIQADNQIYVFTFVTEHLEDLKIFVKQNSRAWAFENSALCFCTDVETNR